MNARALLACLALFAGVPAAAATSQVSASGFLVTHAAPVNAPPPAVFAALGHISKWWDPQHTYSGGASNLGIEMGAGGCWCERWSGNSIEHARVLYLARDKVLRLEGSLGPLQEMGVNGILQFTLEPRAEGTALKLTYRVRGSPDAALEKVAAIVDRVLGEALTRLVLYVETGSPVPVAAPVPLQDQPR